MPSGAESYLIRKMGYNDHEGLHSGKRRSGEYRILSFGDSFAESVTILRLSYLARLQEQLTDAAKRPVRVVNLARSGTSFSVYLAELELWSGRVKFDAVMMNLYSGNDFLIESAMLTVRDQPIWLTPSEASGLRYGTGVETPSRFTLRFLDYLWSHSMSRFYVTRDADRDERYHEHSIQQPLPMYMKVQGQMAAMYRVEVLDSLADGHF